MKGRDRWAFFKDSFSPRFGLSLFVRIRVCSLFSDSLFSRMIPPEVFTLFCVVLWVYVEFTLLAVCVVYPSPIYCHLHTCIYTHVHTLTCTRACTHIPTPNFLNAHQTNPLHPKRSLSSPRSLLPSLMTSIPGIAFISFRYSDPGEENLLFWSVCVLASVVRSLRSLH